MDKINLTPRQSEVLYMLAKGLTNEEIACQLSITIHTVKAHLCAIFETLKARSRIEAVVCGIRLGLINLKEIDL